MTDVCRHGITPDECWRERGGPCATVKVGPRLRLTALEAEAHIFDLYAESATNRRALWVSITETEEARARLSSVELARTTAGNPTDDWKRMTDFIEQKKKERLTPAPPTVTPITPSLTFRNPRAAFLIIAGCVLLWIAFVAGVVISSRREVQAGIDQREHCALECQRGGQVYESFEKVGRTNVCRCRR